MAKVGNIVIYRPKEGRENDLFELVKKHWAAAHKAGLASDEPARVWRATDKRTGKVQFVERFFWVDEEASTKAHHHPDVQAIWVPMDEVLEDMTILVVEEVPGHPPAKAVPPKRRAPSTRGQKAARTARGRKAAKPRVRGARPSAKPKRRPRKGIAMGRPRGPRRPPSARTSRKPRGRGGRGKRR